MAPATRSKSSLPSTTAGLKWAPWARMQSLGSGLLIVIGGIVSFWYPNKILAIVNILLGLLICLIEYPTPYLSTILFKNYYVRTVFYLGCCAPAALQAPTITGGLTLFFAALTYAKAAVNTEKLT